MRRFLWPAVLLTALTGALCLPPKANAQIFDPGYYIPRYHVQYYNGYTPTDNGIYYWQMEQIYRYRVRPQISGGLFNAPYQPFWMNTQPIPWRPFRPWYYDQGP
jgi:hypothetical protein